MPCESVHLLTAGRALRHWTEGGGAPPFDVGDPRLVQDFLAGAMAPDIGFVPGVPRLMSELAHYISTGVLVQSLLATARTEGEQAFGWGWATHHLTDVLIHPLVGKAVGDVLYGDPDRRVNASENEEVHVSVEVGLDILILNEDPTIPSPTAASGLEAGELRFLSRALNRTYGLTWDPDQLVAEYRVASRQFQIWPHLIRAIGRAWRIGRSGQRAGLAAMALRSLSRATGTETAARGLLTPRMPPSWLPTAVRDVAEEFPERFQELVDSGGREIEDRNLETGLLESEPADHPNTDKALARLANLRAEGGWAGAQR